MQCFHCLFLLNVYPMLKPAKSRYFWIKIVDSGPLSFCLLWNPQFAGVVFYSLIIDLEPKYV
jgi:hypothetical protein